MKIIKRILLILIVLAILIVLIGFLLPRHYKVERSIVINATPAAIFPLVNATTSWPQWSIWNQRDPAMTITYSGTGGGAGAKWSWKSKSEGNGEMEFTDVMPERKITYRLTFADFGSTAIGTIAFVPVDEKSTTVKWTNEGDMGRNPLFRYVGLMMDRMVGKDFDASLARLKTLVEMKAAPAAPAAAPAEAATSAAAPTQTKDASVAPSATSAPSAPVPAKPNAPKQ